MKESKRLVIPEDLTEAETDKIAKYSPGATVQTEAD